MPFMDHNLIETLAQVPRKVKFNGIKLKPLMKSIGEDYLPSSVCKRSKKGFHIPLADWFRGVLEDYVYDNLNRNKVTAVEGLKYEPVVKLMDRHCSKKEDNSFKLINLLVLVEWQDQFG